MMNKLCTSLVKGSLFQMHKPLVGVNTVSFASSKHQKQNKSSQIKNPQSQNNSLLKSTTTLQNQNQKSKTSPPQQPNQSKSVLTQQQKKQLALQQKLQAIYTELQSFPSDSYETVMENYKRIKSKLNDRRFYVPNKPELLTQLDSNMELIKQHHKIWRAPSTAPQRRLTDTKSEIIEWELQQAKKKYYLSLLDNEKVLIAIAGATVLIVAGIEYYWFVREPEDESKKIPRMFL